MTTTYRCRGCGAWPLEVDLAAGGHVIRGDMMTPPELCGPVDTIEYAGQRHEADDSGTRTGGTGMTAHTHGRFQRFMCWVGAHPTCCHRQLGLLQNFHKCVFCAREWAGP